MYHGAAHLVPFLITWSDLSLSHLTGLMDNSPIVDNTIMHSCSTIWFDSYPHHAKELHLDLVFLIFFPLLLIFYCSCWDACCPHNV